MNLPDVEVVHTGDGLVELLPEPGLPQALLIHLAEAAQQWVKSQGTVMMADPAGLHAVQTFLQHELLRLVSIGDLWEVDGCWAFRQWASEMHRDFWQRARG